MVNQVLRQYNGLGQITAEYQEHGGAVVTGGGSPSPKVQYTYSEMSGGANHSRLTKVTYPNGRVLRYEYNSGLDTSISRVSFLADDSSGSVGTHLEEYGYLGLGTIVERNRPQPGTKLTLVKQSGEGNGEAGDQYAGLDRFGRVLDQRWYKASTTSDVDRFKYAYDANSNRVSKDVRGASNPGNLDESYTYDGLDRLTKVNRGTLSSGTISDANATYSQSWGLDQVGNWGTFTTDSNGGGSGGDTTQTRTHDFQSRLTGGVGTNTPEYDAAGSMIEDEQGNEYNYDAWHHLVAYDAGGNGGTADVAYGYDALGRRIVEDPATGDTTDLYYSLGRQVLEERLAGVAELQNVWGLGYVNQLVLRDRDTVSGGGLEERLYVQQDANYNVTSLTDTSGAVVERYVYDAYGKRTVLNGDWTADGAEDDYANASGFQGGRHDPVTTDVHFDRRDLAVNLGRMRTADPTGYPDGMNRYEFVMSGPTGMVDPTGLDGGEIEITRWVAGGRVYALKTAGGTAGEPADPITFDDWYKIVSRDLRDPDDGGWEHVAVRNPDGSIDWLCGGEGVKNSFEFVEWFVQSRGQGIDSMDEVMFLAAVQVIDAAADNLPVVGQAKMFAEGVQGDGLIKPQDIHGWNRTFRIMMPLVFLGLVGALKMAKGRGARVGAHQVAADAAQGFGVLKCEEAAAKIQGALQKAGHGGQRVVIRGGGKHGFISSKSYDNHQTPISNNGLHVGIRVGDTVYDNLHPNGMKFSDWVNDFSAVGGTTHSITDF